MALYEFVCYLQHVSLLLQLQLYGSCKQIGQIIVLHPIHVLSALLQPQCLQSLIERISSTMNTIFLSALLQPQCLQSLIERISSTMNTIFMTFGWIVLQQDFVTAV